MVHGEFSRKGGPREVNKLAYGHDHRRLADMGRNLKAAQKLFAPRSVYRETFCFQISMRLQKDWLISIQGRCTWSQNLKKTRLHMYVSYFWQFLHLTSSCLWHTIQSTCLPYKHQNCIQHTGQIRPRVSFKSRCFSVITRTIRQYVIQSIPFSHRSHVSNSSHAGPGTSLSSSTAYSCRSSTICLYASRRVCRLPSASNAHRLQPRGRHPSLSLFQAYLTCLDAKVSNFSGRKEGKCCEM